MEITYGGGTSFSLKGQRSVHINPQTPAKSDINLYTCPRPRGKHIVNGPGEYEIGEILIVTLRPRPDAGLIHAVNVDGINVLFVDGAGAILSDDDLASIGKVDALIVDTHDLKAAEALVQEVMPRVTLPYGRQAIELCALLGVKDAQPQSKLLWSGTGAVARAVLLKAPGARARKSAA